jgi:hypothetical protein
MLVEGLHQQSQINKKDIGKFIGVSAPTVRNYTGLWRLVQRGGLSRSIVCLMDASVLPASNPYAWLRLTSDGVREALERYFADGDSAEEWIHRVSKWRSRSPIPMFSLKFVESATSTLPSKYYREDDRVRALKKQLGLRRGASTRDSENQKAANATTTTHLQSVAVNAPNPIISLAAASLVEYFA